MGRQLLADVPRQHQPQVGRRRHQGAHHQYAEAFGREGLEDQVSGWYGIDSINGETCTTDDDCNKDAGESCSIRDGKEGTCIETWFGPATPGPCRHHGEEPEHDITYNGVEFKVNDIKALITASYDKGRA